MRVEQPEKPARPAKQHAMHRRVRVLLWSVVLAFVIVVCVDRIETGMLVNHARVSPEAVDLIGRHRTHSQHVVLHALLLASKPETNIRSDCLPMHSKSSMAIRQG